MYPVRLCLHILPDVLWHDGSRLLAGPWILVFGSVRFLFERYQASWISQQKVVESASLLKFRGFPIMRTITATTAFKMPLYGINFPLSACQESSTVFRNTEKLYQFNFTAAKSSNGLSRLFVFYFRKVKLWTAKTIIYWKELNKKVLSF